MHPKLILHKLQVFIFAAILINNSVFAQDTRTEVAGIPINYDESKVPSYTLPDPLTLQNGQKVTSPEIWQNQRRAEILHLFETEQFGKVPYRKNASFNIFDAGTPAFEGKAIRKQVTIYFTEDTSNYKADLLIYLPANINKPQRYF